MTTLKEEKPAIGIMKTHDFGDAMYYAVSCQCGNPDDMINFSVELETDSWNIVLNTEFTPKSAYWKTPFNETSDFENSFLWSLDYTTRCFLNRLYHRINTTWELWTKGYITYSQSTVMNEQQALNYAATINQSIEDLRTFRNNLDIKRKENIDTDAEDGC